MKQFEILKAKREDKKDILNIIESWKPYHWDIKPVDEHLTRFFDSNDFAHDKFFVGLIDDRIVSVIGYYHDHPNEIGWLEWFYTHKDYNHRGIGKLMFNFVLSELKPKKAGKLFVNTSSDPFYRSALAFYQKMGFNKIDVANNFYGKDEHKIILSKNLG